VALSESITYVCHVNAGTLMLLLPGISRIVVCVTFPLSSKKITAIFPSSIVISSTFSSEGCVCGRIYDPDNKKLNAMLKSAPGLCNILACRSLGEFFAFVKHSEISFWFNLGILNFLVFAIPRY